MHGHGKDLRIIVEGPLNTISVVGVGIHVGDPDSGMLFLEPGDSHYGVVIEAETTGGGAERVVEPTGDTHSMVHLAIHYYPAGFQDRAHHQGPGLVDLGNDRVVRRPDPVAHQLRCIGGGASGLLHEPDVGQAVGGE